MRDFIRMPPRKAVREESNVKEVDTKEPEVKVKAKREKKSTKHQVVAVVTQDGIQGMFTPELRRPLIAHLPINSTEVKFYDQIPKYDPNPPCVPVAYEDSMTNPFAEENAYELNTIVEFTQTSTPQKQEKVAVNLPEEKKKNQPIEYGPSTLLVCYSGTKDVKELPSSTTVACFWCCDSFESRPCVIPAYISDNIWHVYGNFCTPHCASAYILSELLDTHVRWERLALLHRLYAKYCNGRIYPSPNRECLERFGGPMSTDNFRTLCQERRIRADIHFPPMVSILASMDTKPIDFYETSLRNTVATTPSYVPTEGLKLKRSKPLKDRESTLDACLNIQIRTN